MQINALRLQINGTVQGVGFRPAVYKVANRLGLSGWVKNTSNGVEVVISDTSPHLFLNTLNKELPELAQLDSIVCEDYLIENNDGKFEILPSIVSQNNDTQIPPDSALCRECLKEIFDPNSKYYLYPFTSCTNCGPRYTLIDNLPYDRNNTRMANYPMCNSCNMEYVDPLSRRYHAETCCCPGCGPKYNLDLKKVALAISEGKIIALKAIGGYVLIADAKNEEAITRLRLRKKRAAKPFAMMALNPSSIMRHFAKVNEKELRLLESHAAPIVLLQKKSSAKVAKNVAPDLNSFGFMIANNPVYYLLYYYLLGEPQNISWLDEEQDFALIVTSANSSGNPIITEDNKALELLSGIADLIVSYDREITMPCDDSVATVIGEENILIRRARGYVPKPFYLGYNLPEVLGLGAHLKNTICFTRGNKAYLSQYIGDMSELNTIEYYHKILDHYTRIYNFKPEMVVSDLHPDFYVSQLANNFECEFIQLQHHNAHLCSVLASAESAGYDFMEPLVLGCILDGYGYGEHGEALGGELIMFNRDNLTFTNLSQLPEIYIPGGDLAEKEPWRTAVTMCLQNDLPLPRHLLIHPLADQLIELFNKRQFATTTSMGRVFSGLAALLNVVNYSEYEAHAPMCLESLVTVPCIDFSAIRLNNEGKPDIGHLIRRIYQIAFNNKDLTAAINTFYGSLAALIEKWIIFQASTHGSKQVVISGGCWQSRYLFGLVQEKFRNSEIELLIPHNLPFGDECISLGQAWYGAMKLTQF